MDRVGAVHNLSEVFSACLSLRAPAQPESHMSRVQVGPTRPTQADELFDQCYRNGFRRPRILEINDNFFSHDLSDKNRIEKIKLLSCITKTV
jgi:hypothetical protein